MAFGKTQINNAGAGYAFDSGFGKMGVVEGETYYSPFHGIDKRTVNVNSLN